MRAPIKFFTVRTLCKGVVTSEISTVPESRVAAVELEWETSMCSGCADFGDHSVETESEDD